MSHAILYFAYFHLYFYFFFNFFNDPRRLLIFQTKNMKRFLMLSLKVTIFVKTLMQNSPSIFIYIYTFFKVILYFHYVYICIDSLHRNLLKWYFITYC
jgi:hypothetical protein